MHRKVTLQHKDGTPKVISGPDERVEFYVQWFKMKQYTVLEDTFFDNVAAVDQPLPTVVPL